MTGCDGGDCTLAATPHPQASRRAAAVSLRTARPLSLPALPPVASLARFAAF